MVFISVCNKHHKNLCFGNILIHPLIFFTALFSTTQMICNLSLSNGSHLDFSCTEKSDAWHYCVKLSAWG